MEDASIIDWVIYIINDVVYNFNTARIVINIVVYNIIL